MKIALKTPSGYVCAELGGDDNGIVNANRASVGPWETWIVEAHGDKISLKTLSGWYLCAEEGGGKAVHANRSQAGPWESFTPSSPLVQGVQVDFTTSNGSKLAINGQSLFTIEVIEADIVDNPLPRLIATRLGFKTPDGRGMFLAGASAFMHYEIYLRDGADAIRPLLQQVKDLGANCIRVFGMAHYIPVNAGRPPFKPQGDRYFDEIPSFCSLTAEYGLYVYWSVFPDNALINVPDLRGFMNRVVDKLKQSSNTLGELTNEQDAHSFNNVNPSSVDRPSGISFCSGSYGDIGGPQPSPWDFVDYHLPRHYPTHIKDACVVDHPNYVQGLGVFLGEPDRFGSGGNLNTDQARMTAGACRETALGMVFHSVNGRESQLYDSTTLDIAKISFNALIGKANG